jgi:hypothetical protein
MLLIDCRRHVMSVTARLAPAPFLSLRFPNVQGVLGYLAPFRDDVWFVRALQQEMLVATGSVPAGGPHPARLIDEAARAVTRGRFQIAVELAGRIDVVFDPTRGYERPGFDVVAFASRSVAAVFLSDQLLDDANASAFSAALLHPASAWHSGIAGVGTGLGSDQPGLVGRVAPLLWLRYLILQPAGLSQRRFRLLWADRSAPVTTIADAAAAPDPPQHRQGVAPAASRRVTAAASRADSLLPDPPDSITPQAQTLIDAARNGTPFCEECARRAAAMADA